MELTERDVAILADLTRFYAMTVEQVARRHFGAVNTAANRLAQLVSAGYVRVERPRFRGRAAYMATHQGARIADVGMPPARFSAFVLPHRLAVVDLADALLTAHPGAAWVTERELRLKAMSTVRDRRFGRLLDGTPHVPDGALVEPGGPAEGTAIELEQSFKKPAEYARILRWYGGELRWRRVRWYCATETIRRRLLEAIAQERMDDFVSARALPPGVTVSSWG